MRYAFSDGGHKYSGKNMIEAHARLFPMGLGGEEFDLVAGALVSTLQSINVPADIISDIVAVVSPLRSIFVDGRNNYLAEQSKKKTIFDRLGEWSQKTLNIDGDAALTIAVDKFYIAATTHPKLAKFFADADMTKLKRHQVSLIAENTLEAQLQLINSTNM
jgi:truncated hemoglobin YjbI